MKSITIDSLYASPEWAGLQRELFRKLDESAMEYVSRYVRDDGTLIWRSDWPGMDGSDDPYEGFMNLAHYYALGGREELKTLALHIWEGITWQFTEYGQIDREFDAYYDWMHHGEGYLFFYFLGFSHPYSLKNRQRAVRFAKMYTGEDPLAANYDSALKLIRSPLTGSMGPRHVTTREDWCTHRGVLDNYPAPFEDLQGVDYLSGKCPWSDDAVYDQIIQRFNKQMARGDVPLNLNATSLVAHAYLYTGEDKYKQWVLDYLQAWEERAASNGGLIPDNVGLSGIIGEYNDGKWWGGYYGWRWPHGFMTIIEPILNACMNAVLLTGDDSCLDLARSQLDYIWSLGRMEDGNWVVPHKHTDSGWTDYRVLNPAYPVYLWTISMAEQDRARVDRLSIPALYSELEVPVRSGGDPVTKKETKHYAGNTVPWYLSMRGDAEARPGSAVDYATRMLTGNLQLVDQQIAKMRSDEGDPVNWVTDGFSEGALSSIHKWQEMCPIYMEGLVQTMLGAPAHLSHGGLQHARVRYYDAKKRRPGLPEGAAALVTRLTACETELILVNTDSQSACELVVQGGSFGEHGIDSAEWFDEGGTRIGTAAIGDRCMKIALSPGAGARFVLRMSRYAYAPSYDTPWAVPVSLISGRQHE